MDQDNVPALGAGGAFAAGVQKVYESLYFGIELETAIAYGLHAMLHKLPSAFEPPRDPATLCEALVGYFDTWGESGYTPTEVEFTFAGPLPVNDPYGNPWIYEGRTDSLVEGPDGLWIQDEKTTTRMGPGWPQQWSLRSQFFGYMWACRQLGYPVQGVIIRGVGLYKAGPPRYVEARVLYTPYLVERWLENTCEWLENLNKYLVKGVFPMAMDEACTVYAGCPFKDSCLGQNPQEWLTFKEVEA